MQSIYNLVFLRSAKLLQAARLCPSVLVQRVFSVAASFSWSFYVVLVSGMLRCIVTLIKLGPGVGWG